MAIPTVNVGLVGFGMSGRLIHAPLIQASGMRLTGVVTSRPLDVSATVADARPFATLEDMLTFGGTDLVVIATPNHLHVSQARDAMRAGHHVVIDKPAALDCAELDSLLAIPLSEAQRIAVFHNRRWDSDFLTIKRVLRSGALGEINAFNMRWDRFRPQIPVRWREDRASGGGLLVDLGPHMIDQALCLFGRPDWVQAVTLKQRAAAAVEDTFEIVMAKKSLIITLAASSLAIVSLPRYRLSGSRAGFTKEGLDVQEQQLRAAQDPASSNFGVEPISQQGLLTYADQLTAAPVATETGCWVQFYRDLRNSIEGTGAVPVSLQQARDVMEILDAAYLSSNTGRRVELPRRADMRVD